MMIKTGNLLFFATFFIEMAAVSVNLSVLDMNSVPIQKVSVGVPFQIKVHIKNAGMSTPVPTVEGLEQINGKRSGMQMSNVNGATSVTYVYVAQAGEQKQYTIGPAKVVIAGNTYYSDSVELAAETKVASSTKQKGAKTKQKEQKNQPFMKTVIVIDHRLYQGEKIPCMVRFYCPAKMQVTLKNVQIPQLDGIHIEQKGAQLEGVELIDQKPFKYLEWQFDLLFTKSGDLLLKPFHAEYAVEDDQQTSLFSGFAFMFQQQKSKHVYTDALTLEVAQVPLYQQQEVIAVGEFTSFDISASTRFLHVGDALVLSASLTGQGNMHMIEHLPLQNIPEQLRAFESQIRSEQQKEEVKTFEYVIQAVHDGVVTIPSQTFVFFNPKLEKHLLLKSKAVDLMIKAKDLSHVVIQNDQQAEQQTPDGAVKSVQDNAGEIQNIATEDFVCTDLSTGYYGAVGLPDWLFYLGIFLLFYSFLFHPLILFFIGYSIPSYRRKTAYRRTFQALYGFEKYQRADMILPVLAQFFYDRGVLTQKEQQEFFFINELETKCSFSSEHERMRFKKFIADIIEAAYMYNKRSIQQSLWTETYHWIRFFKQKGL